MLWTDQTPHFPSSPKLLWWGGDRGIGDEGVKLSQGIGGEKVFNACAFVSHYLYLA